MDLVKAMRTFVAVVDNQSFSDAASKLDLVTSAVSRQVAELEKYFDAKLLYRTTRSMHVTAEGEYFLAQFRDVLYRLDHLELHTQSRKTEIAGSLKVTAPLHSDRLGILDEVSGFLDLYPDVNLSWLLVNRYVNLVEEGIDLAVRVGKLSDSGLVARHYSDLNTLLVASPKYLRKRGEPTHPTELVGHRFLSDSSTTEPNRWPYVESGKEKKIRIRPVIEINLAHLVAKFAADGHGIARVPDFLVQDYFEAGALKPILTNYQTPPTPINLVYHPNRQANPALHRFVDFLMENRSERDSR